MTYSIIDISQPVSSKTACFPGDTPFSRQVTLRMEEGATVNLTSFTMSPHVGTHADAPSHIQGRMEDSLGMASGMPLLPYIGPCAVLDLSSVKGGITSQCFEEAASRFPELPPRVVFKTQKNLRFDVWEGALYSHFTVELVAAMKARGIIMAGLDTPSVDHVDSKDLQVHHALIKAGFSWLENLDLTDAQEGLYFLCAAPLKLTELEASPVRAVLIKDLV
ncbi:MAG TPA: cyclase family protein [Candidatus Melainabacteria bacterium]|nr:cyclase family protein [Candidatus Melainabacteria bacterium]